MDKNFNFRSWYYLRVGWSTYFALIFTVLNTLTVTYYLAIEKAPFLNDIFPSFLIYITFFVSIGVPILILVGWAHFRKSHAYASEAEITTESNPYFYKAAPGWSRDVMWPFFFRTTDLLLKISNNEKINEEEMKEIREMQKNMLNLMKGGSIGNPRKPTI